MRKAGFFLIIFLTKLSVNSYGQEFLFDLQTIPIKESIDKKASSQSKTFVLLTLPFFDDFSKGFSYPDPKNWSDSYIIINQNYPINPPTIGVATFDAINQKGELYEHLSTSSVTADTLTSIPIDLYYTETDNVYFSFQYQPKGLGKASQPNDSLVVEFFSKDDNTWIRVWSVSANFTNNKVYETHHLSKSFKNQTVTNISNQFFTVNILVDDTRFLKKGFKFRFMNYASLPTNIQIPSIRGNGDQWHIDLVYLNKNRSDADTLLNDVSYSQPLKSILNNYESIPWKHFTDDAKQSELSDPLSFNINYRNLGEEVWNVTRNYIITNQSDPINIYSFSGGAENILPLTTFIYPLNFDYTFSSNWTDSAKYILESYLITDFASSNEHLRWNDTIRYTQKFLNYYAYDDGSAENSYGILGEGSQNGMVAVKYHSYLSDSLKGIMMYFNRTKINGTLYDPQQIKFQLTVWSDVNGKPGSVLYKKIGLKPIFTDSLNTFTLYAVDIPIIIGGDFWIGWVNTTVDMLNIGFDLNNVHNDKLYYNLSGEWVQSQFEGSLMIRPVFGKLTQNATNIEKSIRKVDFSIYPNPASNQIAINIDESAKPEMIRIVNLAGQVVLSKRYESNSIDLSNIPTGIYLFQLTLHNRITTTKKLVIIK